MDYYQIGQRIRKYRKTEGLSQEQLAEKIGISVTHMSHIETGNTKLSLPVFVRTAEILNIPTDCLLQDRTERQDRKEEIMHGLLDDCTEAEAQAITDIARAAKRTIRKHL